MSTKVLLEVGERNFRTTKETLAQGSEHFKQLFSDTWKSPPEGDPIYVDTDPDAFAHILRYLRLGIFPLIYDSARGHDYAMYGVILEEAKMFGIAALINWLEKQQYHEAMKIDYFRTGEDKNALIKVDSSLAVLRPTKDVCAQYRKIYHCANGWQRCFDNLGRCGRACDMSESQISRGENPEASETDPDDAFATNRRKLPAIKFFDLYERTGYNHLACVDRPIPKNRKKFREQDKGRERRMEKREINPFKVFPKALQQPPFPADRPLGDPLKHWWYGWDINRKFWPR